MIQKGINMTSDIHKFVQYWKDRYTSQNLNEWLKATIDSMPSKLKMSIQKLDDGTPLFPEPYYGYLSDDTSNDILLLLLNPGEVKQDVEQVNIQTIERFKTWSKNDYLDEKNKISKDGFEWRDARRRDACRILDGTETSTFRFLHTIEYFPFHSKKFDFLDAKSRRWIMEWEATHLMINAVREISLKSMVHFIFAIGILWTTILEDYGFEQQSFITLGPKKNSHRIWRYQLPNQPHSLPIVVYVSGAGRMGLPTAQHATSVIRQMLS
jgi:hypothetical protein